jgi:hypothetical protein
LDESAWKGKCGRKLKRANIRAKLCKKLHGIGKFAGKKLVQKYKDKCCMTGTTTTDATKVADTTTAAPTEAPPGATTKAPEEETPEEKAERERKERERKNKEKCMGYDFADGYTNPSSAFKTESTSLFKCAKLCTQTPRCNAYEFSKSKKACYLLQAPAPVVKSGNLANYEDMYFCGKPEDLRAGPCEEDYDQTLGYVNGAGTVRDVGSIEDTLACADLCNKEKACNSYEYWHQAKRCELNWNEEPTHGQGQERSDMYFCIKSSADQTKICKKGYELQEGQINGGGQVTTTTGAQEEPVECADLCDNDPACNSYEYSLRYERCELNYRPEPNHGGHWYDMHLCSKPSKRRAKECPKDPKYDYKLGQLSGQQFVTKTLASLDECADECEKDPRCNSFEYSQTHNRCELNNPDIPNAESEWYDMKFCQKPLARRAVNCGEEYDYIYGRVPGGGSKQRLGGIVSTADCAGKCDALEECRSYEYDLLLRYCDLNWQPAPTHNDTENNFKFCSKKENNRATSCKGDYVKMEGSIPGHGQILYRDGITADACKDLCDDDGGCDSYEYSHLYNRCELNWWPEPNSQVLWYDSVFCSKPEEDREPACNAQYEYKTGQLSGHQYVTLTLHTMEECASKCTEDARCNSYEYSWKYNRCELMNKDETNSESPWYDLRFCYKPEDMRDPPCEESYEELDGYISGSHFKTIGAVPSTRACATHCDDEEACNSYEYTVMGRSCELHWKKNYTNFVEGGHGGWKLCVKAPEDRETTCKLDFKYMAGQRTSSAVNYGHKSATQSEATNPSPESCAQKCDDDEECYAYEYSLVYHRCEILYRPIPNAPSTWYDMRFCQKPEKRWRAPCADDYVYKIGQGVSQYWAGSFATIELCSAACDKDPRCNIYGYSRNWKWCWHSSNDVPVVNNDHYDMKWCVKPEAKRPKDCASNYDYIYGRVPGGGSVRRLTRTATMMNTADCAKTCDEEEACRSYEYDLQLGYCDMNYQPAPTHNDTENAFKFCSKKENDRATSCKAGYIKKDGQIPGAGQISYKNSATADDCVKLCQDDDGCNSYEYSHVHNRCELNYGVAPTSTTRWYDLVHCEKPEDERHPFCAEPYEFKEGQRSGSQYATLTKSTMEECGETCTDDPRCNSYEYSHKYNRCELNNLDTVNTQSLWYDMKFCFKPEAMRDGPCGEEYDQKDGHTPGAQVRTIGSVVDTEACAKLCDDEDACRSYEYNVMARACELHWNPEPTTAGVHAGYVFCQKSEEDRSKSCLQGFSLLPGQRTGASVGEGHMDVTTLQTADECAKKCDDDETCYAYEYSHAHNRCERLWRPAPNAVSTWYDMRFCQKPEKKWLDTCASDYEYKIGKMAYYATKNGIEFEACAEACDNDPRCNMYGYSRKYKWCWFDKNDVPVVTQDYYDMKFCRKPDHKRPQDCAKNYDYIYGRVPGGGSKQRLTRTATLMNTADCGKKCDEEEGCRSYEYDVNLGYCDMNWQPAPTHNDTENEFKFCSKKENDRAPSCIDDYIVKSGAQFNGGGTIGTWTLQTAEECAEKCDGDGGCNSYEYSHAYNRCEMNFAADPNAQSTWYDMLFCQKPEGRREPPCDERYEFKTGQLSGQQYITVTLQSMQECADRCTDDARCNSYEYSWRHRRCELNHPDATNTESLWYDMKFCYKPLDMRPPDCADDYDEFIGHVTGGGTIRAVGAIGDSLECAQLCDEDDACMTYEYSVMAQRCELNWEKEVNSPAIAAGYHSCQKAPEDREKNMREWL